jgi:hypothetical protein
LPDVPAALLIFHEMDMRFHVHVKARNLGKKLRGAVIGCLISGKNFRSGYKLARIHLVLQLHRDRRAYKMVASMIEIHL